MRMKKISRKAGRPKRFRRKAGLPSGLLAKEKKIGTLKKKAKEQNRQKPYDYAVFLCPSELHFRSPHFKNIRISAVYAPRACSLF